MVSHELSSAAPKDIFYSHFQSTLTALSTRISSLQSRSGISGDGVDAMNQCLADIARLQKEVQDAASYTPTFDQEVYAEGLKRLRDEFDQKRASLQPKPKFAFKKSSKKNDPSSHSGRAPNRALQQQGELFGELEDMPSLPDPPIGYIQDFVLFADSKKGGRPGGGMNVAEAIEELKHGGPTAIEQPAVPSINSVSIITSQKRVHIIQPALPAHKMSTGLVTMLQECILDMTTAAYAGQSLAALTIKDIRGSLLLCGSVNGATHVTGVERSVIVVATKQFRMHDCRECIVYLHANGLPIIEDCKGIEFAPLPSRYAPLDIDLIGSENRWNQVQDFKWLQMAQSPHWSILPEERRLTDEQWTKVTSVAPDRSFEESLEIAGVRRGLV